jgi:hypothetical protein
MYKDSTNRPVHDFAVATCSGASVGFLAFGAARLQRVQRLYSARVKHEVPPAQARQRFVSAAKSVTN